MLMLIAALTGNFGMGKSYVLSLFADLGAVTIESDRVVGELLRESDVIAKVRGLLGEDVTGPDGGLDKKAIAGKIFEDREMKARLESLIHPLVFKKVDDLTASLKDSDSLVIIEVPLLYEGGYQGRFEKVITVFTAEETAMERLLRSGVSPEDARARLKNQLPISEKKALADYLIDNGGSTERTKEQVEEVDRSLRMEMKKRRG